jgi:hypothetical protein
LNRLRRHWLFCLLYHLFVFYLKWESFRKPTTETESTVSQNRPKIWSVSEFLNTPKEEVPQSKSGSSNSIMNAMNRSLANAGSYFYLQTNNHSLPHGRYSAFGAYPHLSLSHTTLSYPYTPNKKLHFCCTSDSINVSGRREESISRP